MDRRLDSEIMSPMYGFYSFFADEGYKLTEDCADLAELIGETTEDIAGKELADYIASPYRTETTALLKEQIERFGETEVLIDFVRKDGTSVCVLTRGKVEEDRYGNEYVRVVFLTAERTGRAISKLKDMAEHYRTILSQNEKQIDMLQTYAEQDSLTGILNAGTTRTLAEEYISSVKGCCAMLIIDFDDFKHVNDHYGHMVGDEVLISAANVLKMQFRSNDIVGRIGGDEFLVLMKDISDKNIVALRCKQIIKAFNDMHFPEVKDDLMSCSVGAVVTDAGGLRYDEMFLRADKAMYRAKRSGGGKFVLDEGK